MRLHRESLADTGFWEERGYTLPGFDVETVRKRTLEAPSWLHVGAGNIFRIFPAALQQKLLGNRSVDTGIIVTEMYDEQIIDSAFTAFDNLTIAVTLEASGELKKEILGSIVEALKPRESYNELKRVFCAPSLQMVSFTITEKGYAVKDSEGKVFPWIAADLGIGEGEIPSTTIGLVTWLCYRRYQEGRHPLALVSMDNCSHNGTVLEEAVRFFAESWVSSGLCDAGFLSYLGDPAEVSFPWSMIDKITPRPAESIIAELEGDGLEDMGLKQTDKHTFVAPFVNAESSQYLAIEELFPNGRPPLEEAGVIFSDRETIDRIEKMKVCTCLNPLHTVLAVFGCLLGYTSISDEMGDPMLKALVERVGYDEGLPVVVDPGIMSAEDFINDAINLRFPNPFVPDTPQRIASDTSLKIPVRFGETLKAYIARGERDLGFLRFIPLFFAGWLRYLMAVDDRGAAFEQSPDPNLPELHALLSSIFLGEDGPFHDRLQPLLSRADIFGIDLYEFGLGTKVEEYFAQMNSGPHAIRETLQRYLGL